MVFPKGLKIKEGEIASFRVYTNVSEVDLKNEVEVSFPEKYQNNISIKNFKSKFKVNPLRNEQCFASFEIEGLKECDYFDLNVNYKNNLKTQVRVSVFIEKNVPDKKFMGLIKKLETVLCVSHL